MCLCPVILPLLPQRCTENTWDSHAIEENCAVPSPIVHAQAVDSRLQRALPGGQQFPSVPTLWTLFRVCLLQGKFLCGSGLSCHLPSDILCSVMSVTHMVPGRVRLHSKALSGEHLPTLPA